MEKLQVQRLIRKNKDILYTAGYGLLIFVLWALLKTILYVFGILPSADESKASVESTNYLIYILTVTIFSDILTIGLKSGERILDLGCGFAKVWRNNWSDIPEDVKIYGYDLAGSWADDFAKFVEDNKETLSKDTAIDVFFEDVEDEKAKMLKHAKEEIDLVMSELNKGNVKLHEVIDLKRELEELEDNPSAVIYDETINIGDYVSVPALNIDGKVERIQGKKAHVKTNDGMAFDVEVSKLHKVEKPKEVKKAKSTSISVDDIMHLNVGLELNIIGLRAEEAKRELIKYLDTCRVKHFTSVRIIHGFGSGALRNMTTEYLKTQKRKEETYTKILTILNEE